MLVVVVPVEDDARGIIAPLAGLARFRLKRHAPSPAVARFVDRYWVATWDLSREGPYTQRVFAHPVVNVVFDGAEATVNGVATRVTSRTLEGAGRVLGIMYRPAGFRPFLGRAMSEITDRAVPLAEVLGPGALHLQRAIGAARDEREMVSLADGLLSRMAPPEPHPCEETTRIVDRIAADPALARVDRLAAELGISTRQLQRRFADHVGVGPKAVLRRYRIYEAAERARGSASVDWAALACELGYSDQAHLTRDFSAVIGLPPERYSRECRSEGWKAADDREALDRVAGDP